VVDKTPPSVAVTAPTAGAILVGSVVLTADAADNNAVSGVQFLVDAIPVGNEVVAAPYSLSYLTDTLASGAHVITASARDAAGHTTLSAAVNVTVDNNNPSVSVTAPVDGSVLTGTVNFTADAADNVAVAG